MYRTDKNNNSVYSLCYHFVTVVKYRQKVFVQDDIILDLKSIVQKVSQEFDVEIVEQECGEDHLYIIFRSKPTLDITKYINLLKGRTSRAIREKHKEFLKDKLWGDSFWSPSYLLATSGNVTIDNLKEYIDNQRKLQEDK
jgi:putative transposase